MIPFGCPRSHPNQASGLEATEREERTKKAMESVAFLRASPAGREDEAQQRRREANAQALAIDRQAEARKGGPGLIERATDALDYIPIPITALDHGRYDNRAWVRWPSWVVCLVWQAGIGLLFILAVLSTRDP